MKFGLKVSPVAKTRQSVAMPDLSMNFLNEDSVFAPPGDHRGFRNSVMVKPGEDLAETDRNNIAWNGGL